MLDPERHFCSPMDMATYAGRVGFARIVGSLAACGLIAVGLPTTAAATAGGPPRDDEVLGLVVTREAGTTAQQAEEAVADVTDSDTQRRPVAPGVTAVSVSGLDAAQARSAARELSEQDGIVAVDVDTRVQADAIVDDPLFSQQWALSDPTSGAEVTSAWALSKGAGAVLAVIDSGVLGHEDLDDNLLPGYDFISDPVVANDGDGRDADADDPGDWVDAADVSAHPELFDATCVADSSWHGTHVAGLAAAVADNGRGIAGVAPEATITPVRALGKCGGSMSDVAAAITWASGGTVPGVPANPHPADVVNLSLSGRTPCQQFLQSAIDGAIRRGTTVVVSAGNKSGPISDFSPAGCYDVVVVGAVRHTGSPAPYSNYGVADRDLIVYAPGGYGTSSGSAPVSTFDTGTTVPVADTYATMEGTSMAAPHVSGAAALLAAHTDMTPLAIGEHLRDTARDFACTLSECGAGLLDAGAAMAIRPSLPGAVSDLRAMPAEASIAVQWIPPVDTGSAPLTDYSLEYRAQGGSWLPVRHRWPNMLSNRVISDLSNGTSYQVRVAARTVFGRGPWVESSLVTPIALPGEVRIRSVSYPSRTAAKVLLTPPADATGLQYRLTKQNRRPSGYRTISARKKIRIAGLAKGVRHALEVRAINEMGAGDVSKRAVATPVRPAAVKQLRAARAGTSITVTWTMPARSGLKPRYRVRLGDAAWRTVKRTTVTLRNSRLGAYRVQVQVRNETGLGPIASLAKRK